MARHVLSAWFGFGLILVGQMNMVWLRMTHNIPVTTQNRRELSGMRAAPA